jgi:hypothetical protein
MNRDETKRLLTEIAHLFPRFVNADEDKKLKVDLWAEALEAYEFSEMHKALMTYVQDESKGFPPSVGQLIVITRPEPDPLMPKDHVFMGW